MEKKLRGCRPLDEINAEYSLSCGKLGDYTYRRTMLGKEIEKLQLRLGELDLEAGSCKQQMDAIAAEEAAKPAEVTPEIPGA